MILCCGEALIDFLPREGKDGAAVYQPVNGGSVYNTAIALGRLGVPVGFFAGISTDFFGDGILEGLTESKVNLKYIRKKPQHTTLAFVKLSNGHARYSFIDDASAGRNLVKADMPKPTCSISGSRNGCAPTPMRKARPPPTATAKVGTRNRRSSRIGFCWCSAWRT